MIDLHNDALLVLPEEKLRPYLQQAKKDGISEIWLSIWTTELAEPLHIVQEKSALLAQIQGDPSYPLCRLHLEDAWFVTPENIDTIIKLKPNSVGLTWNYANNLAGGAHSQAGITPWGYQVIKRLENAGIQIDTAHLNRKSFWQFTRVTTRTLVCTHTAFNAVQSHCRNLTNRQIKAIIQTNGQIGLCLVPKFLTKNTTSCSINDIYKHIFYYKKHFPSNNLLLGTDFYGTTQLPKNITNYADLAQLFQTQIIGYSLAKQPIYAYQIGKSTADKRILITAGMHAREWITCNIAQTLRRYFQNIPENVCLTIVPCCNPDGTQLAKQGLTALPHKWQRRLLKINNHSTDFSLWKANARAVDLNVNYNAGWGQGHQNVQHPAPANYIGKHPHSEPETKALLRLVTQYQPTVSIALHSKGEVVYYSRQADRTLAEQVAQLANYQAKFSHGSFGGLTDYLALIKNIPALTIEVGNDTLQHPITDQELPKLTPPIIKVIEYLINHNI